MNTTTTIQDCIDLNKDRLQSTVLVKNTNLTGIELDDFALRLKNSKKPSQIAKSFSNISELNEQHLKHFAKAPYAWKPMQGNIFAGMLLDESLDYIHLVLATEDVLKYILELK